MQKYFNEDTEKFRKYWKALSRFDKKTIRKKIMDVCIVEYPTVCNWLIGACNIPPLAKEKIEDVVGKKIFSES